MLAKLTDKYGRAFYVAPDTVTVIRPMLIVDGNSFIDGTELETNYGLKIEVRENCEKAMMIMAEAKGVQNETDRTGTDLYAEARQHNAITGVG